MFVFVYRHCQCASGWDYADVAEHKDDEQKKLWSIKTEYQAGAVNDKKHLLF